MAFDWTSALLGGLQAGVSPNVQRQMEQAKQDAQEYNKLSSAAETIGLLTKDEAKTKSLSDLRALFEADKYKRQVGEQNIIDNLRQMQMQSMAQSFNRQNQMDAANNEFLANPALTDGVTAPDQRVQSALMATRNPGMVSPHLIDYLLRAQEQQGGGLPQILAGPYPGMKLVTDSRGRSTPQVVVDPNVKAQLTEAQRMKFKQSATEELDLARKKARDIAAAGLTQYVDSANQEVAAKERAYRDLLGEEPPAAITVSGSKPANATGITIKSIRLKQ